VRPWPRPPRSSRLPSGTPGRPATVQHFLPETRPRTVWRNESDDHRPMSYNCATAMLSVAGLYPRALIRVFSQPEIPSMHHSAYDEIRDQQCGVETWLYTSDECIHVVLVYGVETSNQRFEL